MMNRLLLLFFTYIPSLIYAQQLQLNDQNYFEMPGLDVTVFADIYPDGHQTGVTVIQHGIRTAANGDLRLETSPGQWSPVPRGGKLMADEPNQTLTQRLWYPDSSKNRKGFNPIIYPDLQLFYNVRVTPIGGSSFKVTVDLDEPLPKEWEGKVGFNFELFPGDLFGKSYLMDNQTGQFSTQPNGPMTTRYGETLAEPLATGHTLIVAPEEELQRMKVTSGAELQLWDGRTNHNNGWFIIRSEIPPGATQKAIEWVITPNVVAGWQYKPVVQVSQVGYHPDQKKIAIIELDQNATMESQEITLYRLDENGKTLVRKATPDLWGKFLRYQYRTFDFSDLRDPGLYTLAYGEVNTHAFRIDRKVYDRHVWQPTLEYYLPVQMCHMRVNEKYRVWHDLCHLDDALMAPTDTNHFDGYLQGASTLTDYQPLDQVPNLNHGGWHDAGDYDLRVESQIGTTWMLAMMVEEFDLDYDATTIDPEKRLVEIHLPDGKSDAIQQIEHGLATVLGGYRTLGRLYRGIICPTLRQYVMLGDAASMTDNLSYNSTLDSTQVVNQESGIPDDRWVFTEENPGRELYVAAGLAAAARVLKDENPDLANEALAAAKAIYTAAGKADGHVSQKILVLAELILTTEDPELITAFISMKADIIADLSHSGWAVGKVIHRIENKKFRKEVANAVASYQQGLRAQQQTDSPYGVPYKPNIWGAGWSIQRFGVEQYFFHKGWPEHTTSDFYENALNFVLGVHPGINTSSFASGVGAQSVTVAYGVNRADWSFIPGGVASGTALIRPNLPELKVWPFFWQQTEYVMGGGATNYMFLALAVNDLYRERGE
ncbi:glycoside hydrolase family 9 protein [Marinoscillum sp.]|uniref:glycoside hydrolase family 9 protein n=1 Tax=Marinoscillum sp. TaxID=2024838 RepID=UPI003BACDBB7